MLRSTYADPTLCPRCGAKDKGGQTCARCLEYAWMDETCPRCGFAYGDHLGPCDPPCTACGGQGCFWCALDADQSPDTDARPEETAPLPEDWDIIDF